MIQLTASGVRIVKDGEWAAQQQEFAQRHCVLLEGFLGESILRHVPWLLESGEFFPREDFDHTGRAFAKELTMRRSEVLPRAFFCLLNQPALREAVAELTGCEKPIRSFAGRCFAHLSGSGHFDSWHSDCNDGRRYALSIDLCEKPFAGGAFQIRDRKTREVLQTLGGSRFGSAHLFRIHKSVEHRILPVRGAAPRYRYAGWFRSRGSYREVLEESAVPAPAQGRTAHGKDPA